MLVELIFNSETSNDAVVPHFFGSDILTRYRKDAFSKLSISLRTLFFKPFGAVLRFLLRICCGGCFLCLVLCFALIYSGLEITIVVKTALS